MCIFLCMYVCYVYMYTYVCTCMYCMLCMYAHTAQYCPHPLHHFFFISHHTTPHHTHSNHECEETEAGIRVLEIRTRRWCFGLTVRSAKLARSTPLLPTLTSLFSYNSPATNILDWRFLLRGPGLALPYLARSNCPSPF